MPATNKATPASARERILDAAYDLFTRNGIGGTGVNDVLAQSGAAKATLYRTFSSKADLALAVLERRGEIWTLGWLDAEVRRRAADASGQLLAIFDVLEKWFRSKNYEGCLFLRVIHEPEIEDEVRHAAVSQLKKVTSLMQRLAREAGLAEPKQFATTWHGLMNGAIVATNAGQKKAGTEAKHAAQIILDGWPRTAGKRRKK